MRILFMSLVCGLVWVSPALGQHALSLRFSLSGGGQQGEIAARVNDVELGSESSLVYAAGADLMVGLGHLAAGAYYQRHFGRLGEQFTAGSSEVEWGLGANEFGLLAEVLAPFAPASSLAPYVGAGGSWGILRLGDELVIAGIPGAEQLDGDVTVFRAYAVGGLQLLGSLGAKARLGWSFGSIEGDDLQFGQTFTTESGDEISYELLYDGLFGSVALSVVGF